MPDYNPHDHQRPTEADKKRAQEKQRRLEDDYYNVFEAAEEGRRVLADIVAFSGLLRGGFSGNQAQFNDGKEAVALYIMRMVDRSEIRDLKALGRPELINKLLEMKKHDRTDQPK